MNKKYNNYKKDELALIVADSMSLSEVLRKCDKRPVGGNISHLKRVCSKFQIDLSHMTGQAWNKGKVSLNKRNPIERLVTRDINSGRQKASHLRNGLIALGIPEICNECKIESFWNNKKLILEIDHINEKHWDDSPENLQFLCPNCHSQKR